MGDDLDRAQAVCDTCGKTFKSQRALRGHKLHCPPSSKTTPSSSPRPKPRAQAKPAKRRGPQDLSESSTAPAGSGKRQKVSPERRETRKRKNLRVPSVLDTYLNKTRTLDPYPLSYIILHGEESKDDPRLDEARKLFALVYPTIPKDFQHAAVRAHCNVKQDFRSFRTIVLSLQSSEGDQVVSCATVKVHAATHLLEVLFIATNPTLQRRGFGRLLLNLMQDLVRPEGVKLTLACASSDAVPFWRKMGFAVNASARTHGWRLVQLGGTKVMSQEIHENERSNRLSIGEALLRLPISNLRRPPNNRGMERAIPNLQDWVAQARVVVEERKRLQAEEEVRRKQEANQRRIMRIKERAMERSRSSMKHLVKIKIPPVPRRKPTPTKGSKSSRRPSGAIDLVELKRKIRRIRQQNFYLPHDLMDGGSGSGIEVKPHEDHCHRCKHGGRLLCCDSCVLAWHLKCLDTPLEEFPPKEFAWHCPRCKESQKGQEESRSTRSNTRQQWNMRICSLCRRRKEPWKYPEGQWDTPAEERMCEPCQLSQKGVRVPEVSPAPIKVPPKPPPPPLATAYMNGLPSKEEAVLLGHEPVGNGGSISGWEGGNLPFWVPDGWMWRIHAKKKQFRAPNGKLCRNKAEIIRWLTQYEPESLEKYTKEQEQHKTLFCAACNRQFGSPQGYARHMRARHNERSGIGATPSESKASSPRRGGGGFPLVSSSSSQTHGSSSNADPELRCALCHELGHGAQGEGRLEKAGKNIFVHAFCLRFTPGLVSEKGGGVKKSTARREIQRASKQECRSCGECGATMRCGVEECWNTYHLLCGMRSGCKFDKLRFLSFTSPFYFCPSHLTHPCARKATAATRLRQWTAVFDRPLEEKDQRLQASPTGPGITCDSDSESEIVADVLARAGKKTVQNDLDPPLQIEERVEAKFKKQWFPGTLKRTKRSSTNRLEFGVKCDVDKRNSMILWVKMPDIRREVSSGSSVPEIITPDTEPSTSSGLADDQLDRKKKKNMPAARGDGGRASDAKLRSASNGSGEGEHRHGLELASSHLSSEQAEGTVASYPSDDERPAKKQKMWAAAARVRRSPSSPRALRSPRSPRSRSWLLSRANVVHPSEPMEQVQ
uniref:Uncharacterized protein n=1 Tax=Lotharella globosa TaxID=91324 RepID=A0A7S3Z2V9_9EUKA|mmetsp:Transcript_407/g.692  ORF Transcript_407/g.692 Transcript_407/m.692 type:complete len:1113 (+) Transcript_407:136-3474(+)